MVLKSPSKFLSLSKLLAIRDNFYRSEGLNFEYYSDEVDALIAQKIDNRMKQKIEHPKEHLDQIGDFVPAGMTQPVVKNFDEGFQGLSIEPKKITYW